MSIPIVAFKEERLSRESLDEGDAAKEAVLGNIARGLGENPRARGDEALEVAFTIGLGLIKIASSEGDEAGEVDATFWTPDPHVSK